MSGPQLLVGFHLIYFGLVIPLGAIRGRKRLIASGQTTPNRLRRYVLTSLSLVLFGCLSLAVVWRIGVKLFPREVPPLASIFTGICMYVVSITLMLPRWRAAIQKRSPVAELFTPRTTAEWTVWLLVSLLASISEEITWRGVQVILLADLTGHYGLAVLGSANSFAIAHAVQGRRSVFIILVFALSFQLLVWLAGSLYVAMAVHVAYDVTAGLAYNHFHGKSELAKKH